MARSLDSMLVCPAPLAHADVVELAHGGGGTKTAKLVETLFAPAFRIPHLEPLGDGALVSVGRERLAFTADSFVVKPVFFPGGDIGSLAVHGTVNDLAMCGAEPLFLSAGYLLEEGFPMRDLELVVASMAEACSRSGVLLVTGDTKVVDRGKGDGIYVNTSGIGRVRDGVHVGPARALPGDSLFAGEGIRVLAASLPEVVRNPFDIGARERAFYGAHLGGRALDMSAMGLHHKLCHVLGGTFVLPHALTHAILLPYVVAYNARAAEGAMSEIAAALGAGPAWSGLYALRQALGITATLGDLGLGPAELDRAAELAVAGSYPNPREVTREGVRGILEAASAERGRRRDPLTTFRPHYTPRRSGRAPRPGE